MKQSKDKKVDFHEDTHSYMFGGERLTSVTQYISQFKQPFETDRIAEAYARKHAMTKEYVIKMWKEKGEKACVTGTYVHSIFEDYILNTDHVSQDYPKKEAAYSFIEDFFAKNRSWCRIIALRWPAIAAPIA